LEINQNQEAVNFPLYIARRYFVARKSHNIINIISGISVAGVTIGTMALIIVLSVFNGFQDLVTSLFNSFNPDIAITMKEGKTFHSGSLDMEKIQRIPGVTGLYPFIEENALAKYKDKQYIVTIKGMAEGYSSVSGLDTMITEGKFMLQEGEQNYAVIGNGVAYYLGANLKDFMNPMNIYVPRREAGFSGGFDNAFNSEVVFPAGFFSVQQDFDAKYMILPLRFVSRLLEYKDEITGAEIWLAKGADHDKIQQEITSVAGEQFKVKNRYQQQAMLYKIMKSEKWAIFLILTLILFIATFNVIGSLSMLIIDKKMDIAVLQCMGAGQRLVKAIFLTEGMMISFFGSVAGMILGWVICRLQQVYGLVKLGSAGSTFVVNSYPVSMQFADFLFVFITVIGIGFLAAWYPVFNIRRIDTRILNQRG
jgi:lipoprotein-releasing system permease protein